TVVPADVPVTLIHVPSGVQEFVPADLDRLTVAYRQVVLSGEGAGGKVVGDFDPGAKRSGGHPVSPRLREPYCSSTERKRFGKQLLVPIPSVARYTARAAYRTPQRIQVVAAYLWGNRRISSQHVVPVIGALGAP